MFRPRIIPVLLLKNKGLVKSKKFKDFRYIGDPINAVKIFNDLKADELTFLDIDATSEGRLVSLELIKNIGEEANMPFAVGGGIKTIENIRQIIVAGAEKVIVGSKASENPEFIKQAAEEFGSSTISVCIDVNKRMFGTEQVCIRNGSKFTGQSPVEFAKLMEQMGAGEVIIQSVENDGMMLGYNVDLIKKISEAVTIPVVALGGAGYMNHLREVYFNGYANGLAAGSFFVFQGSKKGVLISYPEKNYLQSNYWSKNE